MKIFLRRFLDKIIRLRGDKNGCLKVRRRGLTWHLRTDHYLDRSIILTGAWERKTTQLIKQFVKPGMHILDVGANFGYFTTIFAQLVGTRGKVWAFEPTECFRKRIYEHLELNGLSDRVVVLDYGLSDREQEIMISVGNSSATLHPTSSGRSSLTELISLKRFDDVYESLRIKHIDLVKVDIDGHEPYFIDGAAQFLRKNKPVMVIEFNQSDLDIANKDVRTLYKQLEDLGYVLHSGRTRKPFASRREFLLECGNFTHSANVVAYPSEQA